LIRNLEIFIGEKIASLTNGAVKNGYPYAED
jgi:hypothetical protein